MTIVPAHSRPGLQQRLTTGDSVFEAAVFVAAADLSAYGLFDSRTRAVLCRLVVDWGVVFTNGALRCEHTAPPHAMLADLTELAERLTKTEAQARSAIQTIALEDPVAEVRRRYQTIAENSVFEGDLSAVDEQSFLNDLSTVTAFEPLADLVGNPTASAEIRLTAMERLMAHHEPDAWTGLAIGLAEELPAQSGVTRLALGWLAALERAEDWSFDSIHKVMLLPDELDTELALGICQLIERAASEPDPDIDLIFEILYSLCENPNDSVVLAALTQLHKTAPDQLRSLDWLDREDFGKFLDRATSASRGAPFEGLLFEALNRRVRSGIESASELERELTIALLGTHGHPEHLTILVPLTRGIFQKRRTKALAREAIEAIRTRHRVTHLEGAMSVVGPADGGLALVETKS